MSSSRSGRKPDVFILVFLLVLIFLLAARTPLDSDLFWHLASGKQTWLSGRPMLADVFSYTRYGAAWINHSWLSQLILYGLDQLGGTLALGAWVAALATISMGLVFIQMRGPAIFRAFIVILATTVAAVVWSPRPQLVSLVAFALLGWILYRYKWRHIDQLWSLPLIFFLWANLHGGWSLGFMLIGITLAGEVLNRWLGNRSADVLEWRQIKRLLLWGLAAVPALVINPSGLEILKIPFQTVGVQALQQSIQEWASPDFHELFQQPYLWLLLALLAAFALCGRKVDLGDLLSVIWFGALGLIARRNFGPFALVAAPVLSRYLWAGFCSWRNPTWAEPGGWGPGPEQPLPARRRPRWQRAVNLTLVGIFALAALLKLWVVANPAFVDMNSAQTNPVGAVQYLQSQGARGRIFNEYNWGGYLIWANPQMPIFVDGRTDLFGDEIIGQWMQILQVHGDWAAQLDTWKVDWVLIEPGRPLASSLQSQGWKVAYRDDHSILFQRP